MSTIAVSATAISQSDYKGQESRDIKALSSQKVDDYLNGKGMGYAKAAELNDYPGPRHVLDLSEELSLTQEQMEQTQVLFEAMKAQAVMLGKQLVDKERELDKKFANGTIDESSLSLLLSEIGVLQTKIRRVHLATHLEQKAILSEHQIQQYGQLRGYGMQHDSKHNHSH